MCVHSTFLVNVGLWYSNDVSITAILYELCCFWPSSIYSLESFRFHSATYLLYLPLILLCLLAFRICVVVSSLFYMFNSQSRTQSLRLLSFLSYACWMLVKLAHTWHWMYYSFQFFLFRLSDITNDYLRHKIWQSDGFIDIMMSLLWGKYFFKTWYCILLKRSSYHS